MRLFIALKTVSNKESIFSVEKLLMHKFLNVKWVERVNLHLTLKFLGEKQEKDIYGINRVISNIANTQKPFSFSYHGVSAFPNKKYAKIIFLAVQDPNNIVKLMVMLDKNLYTLGFKLNKSYMPHLTLGRIRRNVINLNEIGNVDFDVISVKAIGISLVRSILSSNGPVYEEISSFGFA